MHPKFLLAVLLAAPVFAQTGPAAAGHWEGAIETPNQALEVKIDLAQNDKGEWAGTIDIPQQNAKGIALKNIEVKGSGAKFVIVGAPGDPTFNVQVSADRKSMSGDFTQGGATLKFQAKRTGDASITPPSKSTPITKELEGAWDGVLSVPDAGAELRLLLTLANGSSGAATGTLNSLDQGSGDMALDSVTQEGSKLRFELRMISGSYAGELKGDDIVGEWTQMGRTLPLTFKRSKKK